MNSNRSFIRSYIVSEPSTRSNHHRRQKLLTRRPDLRRLANKSPGATTTIDQTVTLIEQWKSHPLAKDTERKKKVLTPQEFFGQLNAKLDYLIRTRAIERHRVVVASVQRTVATSVITLDDEAFEEMMEEEENVHFSKLPL